MKILISACPGYGHLYPMLPLARAATQAGHDVIIATGPDLAPHLSNRGFHTWPVGQSFAEAWAERNKALPDLDSVPPEQHMALDISALFGASGAKRAVDLVPRVQDWRPDLIVHEPAEFAAPIAARKSGARHAVHGLGLAPPVPMRAMLEPTMVDLFTTWAEPHLAADIFSGPYLDICPATLRPDGEPAFPQAIPLRPYAGDVLPTDRPPPSLDTLPYQDTVYLTMGTVFHDAPDVFQACLTALRDLPMNIVVTIGRDAAPAHLGPQPPNVLIEPFIPQAALLPLCRTVISHGGAGTMLGTLAHGLPQLIMPQAADQFLNAAAAEGAGASLTLPPGTVTPEAVHDATLRLLNEPRFTTAAKRIQADIDTMPAADDALATLLAG